MQVSRTIQPLTPVSLAQRTIVETVGYEASIVEDLDRALHRLHGAWIPFTDYVCSDVMTPLQQAQVGFEVTGCSSLASTRASSLVMPGVV